MADYRCSKDHTHRPAWRANYCPDCGYHVVVTVRTCEFCENEQDYGKFCQKCGGAGFKAKIIENWEYQESRKVEREEKE